MSAWKLVPDEPTKVSRPAVWEIGHRVRYTRSNEWGPNIGDAGTIVEVRTKDLGKPADEYQVFWVTPDYDKDGKSKYWTTPDDVEWLDGPQYPASPDPTTDEALVARLAWKIADALGDGLHGNSPGYINAARAAIRAMEEKP